MRVEAATEDVNVARVSFSLIRSCSTCNGVEELQDEDEDIDGAEDGDEIQERHVVDEMNAALDDILVEGLD